MLLCMKQPAQSSSSAAPADFARLLAAVASPQLEEASLEETSSESNLGDDVVTVSYERALRAHARYQPADKDDWPLAREGQTGVVIAREAALPVPLRGETLNAQASDPSGTDYDLRSASVTIRLSKAESARLHRHAAEAGVTVSAYLRSCTFEAETLRAEVKAALAELRMAALKTDQAVHGKEQQAFWGLVAFGWLARLLPRRHSASRA